LAVRPSGPRGGITVPVQGRAGFPEDPARPGSSYHILNRWEMLADDLVQFSPESALFEISSSSANAFPAISSAILVLPRSRISFSFFAFSFMLYARSRERSEESAR